MNNAIINGDTIELAAGTTVKFTATEDCYLFINDENIEVKSNISWFNLVSNTNVQVKNGDSIIIRSKNTLNQIIIPIINFIYNPRNNGSVVSNSFLKKVTYTIGDIAVGETAMYELPQIDTVFSLEVVVISLIKMSISNNTPYRVDIIDEDGDNNVTTMYATGKLIGTFIDSSAFSIPEMAVTSIRKIKITNLSDDTTLSGLSFMFIANGV